jgi:hypothetical protein
VGIQDQRLRSVTRRSILRQLGGAGAALASSRAWAQAVTTLSLPGGPGDRVLTNAFPEKGQMILQRTRPPLLEMAASSLEAGLLYQVPFALAERQFRVLHHKERHRTGAAEMLLQMVSGR